MKKIKNTLKKNILNFFLLILSILICLLILEAAITITHPITRIYQYSPYSDYILKPNQDIVFNSKEFKTKVTTNSFGFRGDELNPSKEHKILILGDSFVFGHGVNNTQTIAYQLEKKLNQKFNNTYLVINTGINGYDTKREYNYLAHHAKIFYPEIIIVGFVINDPYSNSGEYHFSTLPQGIGRYIPLHSVAALLEYLHNPKKLLFKLGFNIHFTQINHLDCLKNNACEKGWFETFKYLKKIKAYSDKNNITLVIVHIPVKEQITNHTPPPYIDRASYKLNEFCNTHKIMCIDLLHSSLNEKDYYPIGGHFNSKGNQKTAQYIYNVLFDQQNKE